jgi:hypothetical protein
LAPVPHRREGNDKKKDAEGGKEVKRKKLIPKSRTPKAEREAHKRQKLKSRTPKAERDEKRKANIEKELRRQRKLIKIMPKVTRRKAKKIFLFSSVFFFFWMYRVVDVLACFIFYENSAWKTRNRF